MLGSPDTVPAPRLRDERRLALVVATGTYRDPSLRQLRAPARDIEELTTVLADPEVGGFSVTSVIDNGAHEIRLAIEEFLVDRRPDDLLLLYISCHGLVDPRRRLFFAGSDTLKNRLAATGVEAQWVLEQLDDCRARRQVVILDCCFSGAFANAAKGDGDLGLAERFNAAGRGRVVLTASRGSEYSFEGEPVPGSEMPGSIFTSALVDGIRTGTADVDRDGLISVDDAYAYAFDRLSSAGAQQTPQRWLYGAEGAIFLARNPAGVTVTPETLPDGLQNGLESPHVEIRLGTVAALGAWLTDRNPARALAARQALQHVVESDVPRVAASAQALLGEAPTKVGDASLPPPTEDSPSVALRHPEREETQVESGDLAAVSAHPPSRRSRPLLLAAFAALAVVGTLVAIMLPGKTLEPLLVDDFQTGTHEWGRDGEYLNNQYRIDVAPGGNAMGVPRNASSVYPSAPSNLRIEVDVRSFTPLDGGSSYGVMCHLNEGSLDRYQFTIGEGLETVRITKIAGGRAKFLKVQTVALLNAGDVNRIQAECTSVVNASRRAVRLVFNLNGQAVAEATDWDEPLAGGTIGIRVFSGQNGVQTAFDNFVVTSI